MSSSATNETPSLTLLTFEAMGTPEILIEEVDAQPIMQPASASPALRQQSLNEQGQWTAVGSYVDTGLLPDAPVRIVREGVLNGRRYVVVGISPVFTQAGMTLRASSFAARVQGARRINGIDAGAADDGVSFTPADAGDIPQPQRIAEDAWRVLVAHEGVQRITGAQLADAGVPMDRIPIEHLRVRLNVNELAVDVQDTDQDGLLSRTDEVHFYAVHPGDRWNRGGTFWLTFEPAAGLRMDTQPQPQGGMPTKIAMMEGTWQRDSVYDSLLPGLDDDHWFSGRLDASGPAIQATLQSDLPYAAGVVRVTVNGSSVQPAAVRLVANGIATEQLPMQAAQDAKGAHSNDWSYDFTLPATADSAAVFVQLNSKGAGFALEDVSWQAPVALNFQQRGAAFTGLRGHYTYQLQNAPPDAALYDVTDWIRPQKIELDVAMQFSAGPSARRYVLAGDGTVFTPAISKRETADLSQPLNARALYLAPGSLHDALQPLIAHRRSMGWRAMLIDTQAIYDQWSGGQVSPDAIRHFLRYARATWRVKPQAVILVGDGNYDPLNNTGSAPPSLIPPYLASVDRQMGETACEACYAQLDGAEPLMDTLPDLVFGRLPVKNAAELTAVVNKIIAYETQPAGAWMHRALFIADNTRHADGTFDNAGDFDAFNRRTMALQPAGLHLSTLIYEPLAGSGLPWYERDPFTAHKKAIAMLNEGAAVVNFTGHGLTQQWAYTAPNTSGSPYLLTTQDAAQLNNGSRLPMVLSMACLTGSFHLPAAGGISIDEQMVLAPSGGAIASWSSAGLGILFSYEFLQRGFYKALWQDPGNLTIGSLARASLLDLFQSATCCDEPLRTHALLGDPLTPLRINALPARVYFPLTAR